MSQLKNMKPTPICSGDQALATMEQYEKRMREMDTNLAHLAEQANTREGKAIYTRVKRHYEREKREMAERIPFLVASFRDYYGIDAYLKEANSLPGGE